MAPVFTTTPNPSNTEVHTADGQLPSHIAPPGHMATLSDASDSAPARPKTGSPSGAVLKRSDVINIFLQRPSRSLDCEGKNTFISEQQASPTILAMQYGVASKTIRDIWNRNTWLSVTRPFWNAEEMAASGEKIEGVVAAEKRKRGRPKGCKDAIPRTRGPKRRGEACEEIPSPTIKASSSLESWASFDGSEQGCSSEETEVEVKQEPKRQCCDQGVMQYLAPVSFASAPAANLVSASAPLVSAAPPSSSVQVHTSEVFMDHSACSELSLLAAYATCAPPHPSGQHPTTASIAVAAPAGMDVHAGWSEEPLEPFDINSHGDPFAKDWDLAQAHSVVDDFAQPSGSWKCRQSFSVHSATPAAAMAVSFSGFPLATW